MTEEEAQKKLVQAEHRAELEDSCKICFNELELRLRRWLLIPDPFIIKLICAHYVTNRLPRHPVWLMLVAPSGGGKTEFLNGLLYLPDIFPISILTPNTFLSGMPGKNDASLLPKLNNKIMLYKDWTTVLSMQKDAKAELLAQFREIYDGSMKKVFGNGKIREWNGRTSLLAASTEAIDLSQQQYTHLGERFLFYRIIMPDRKEVSRRALNNANNQEEMAWDIQKAFFQFFKGIDFDHLGTFDSLPECLQSDLVNLADFATLARSGVIRETGFKKEVIFVPGAEMPTRIIQQLVSIIVGCIVVNGGKIMPEDMDMVYKVTLDSIPQTNRMVIMEMAKGDEQTTAEIATGLGYPTPPIRMYLENLALHGVCKRIKGADSGDGGNADKWTMKMEYVSIIRQYEKVKPLSLEEKDKRSNEANNLHDDPDIEAEWESIDEKPKVIHS
jgi:hypothetical protein